MKKLLLTLAVLLGFSATAAADEFTFDFATKDYGLTRATDNNDPYIDNGTKVTEGPIVITLFKTEGKNGMRLWSDGLRFYKSSDAGFTVSVTGGTVLGLEWTVVSGATFAIDGTTETVTKWTGSAESVKVNYTATQNKALKTLKVTYSVSGPVKQNAGLTFGENTSFTVNYGETFTAPTLTKATTAEATYASDNTAVATVDAKTGAVTIAGVGEATITATTPENDEYYQGEASYTINVVKYTKVDLVNIVFDGKFAIYMPTVGVATPFTTAYGYLYPEEVTVTDNAFEVNEAYMFTFTKSGENWTIQRADGKFIGMASEKFTSFNAYDTADAEGSCCYWTVTFDADNNVKIANTGRTGFYMYCCQYNGKWEITNTDATELKENEFLPQLFGDKAAAEAAGIADIATEAVEGAAEYYNLQGIRMQGELAPGLYIRRESNKASKILVR